MLGRDAMRRALPALVAAVALSGCAVFDQLSSDWFGAETTTPVPTPPQLGESFYSSADGLPMHFLPSGSSQVVGRLALHEHVTRTDVQRGYAHVVADNGLEGWVDNAKLLWRLPPTAAPAGTPAPAPLVTSAPEAETPTPIAPPPVEPAPVPVAPAAVPPAGGPLAVPSEIYVPKSQRTPSPTDTPVAVPTPTAQPGLFDVF